MYLCSYAGAAVGGSSILLILPNSVKKNIYDVAVQDIPPPNGVVVAILVNMGSVNLRKPALKVAQLFDGYPKNECDILC
jgi:hypothetical protein